MTKMPDYVYNKWVDFTFAGFITHYDLKQTECDVVLDDDVVKLARAAGAKVKCFADWMSFVEAFFPANTAKQTGAFVLWRMFLIEQATVRYYGEMFDYLRERDSPY